ncbi:MAG: MATE family efflux transporter [Clostridia bacterium]
MNKKLDLTEGSVFQNLVKFMFPIMLTILLQATYGTVDLLIVGQFSSVADLSGVTVGSQIMLSITNLCTGLSMGTTILVGRYIGAKQSESASRVIGVSLALFSTIALAVTLFILFFNTPIVSIMQTPEESFVQTRNYLVISGIGTIFIVFYNLIGSIFRGLGDSKTPLLTVFIACILNIILDLILVMGLNMGASGAGIATVVAQASSVFLSVYLMSKRDLPFKITKKDIYYDKRYIKNILKLGFPVAMQSYLVTFSFLCITAIVNNYGVSQSAAVGICVKISAVIMVVPQAFSQALSAFTAQNIGANKFLRAKQGLFISISLSLAFGIVTGYLGFFHGQIFTRFFTSDPLITEYALTYLKSYAIDCVLVAIMFSFAGFFNGCGDTSFVMVKSVLGAVFIRIPVAYFFSTLPNTTLFLIGLATPSSTFIEIILCVIFYIKTKKGVNALTKAHN